MTDAMAHVIHTGLEDIALAIVIAAIMRAVFNK